MSDGDPGAGNLCNFSFMLPYDTAKQLNKGLLILTPILRVYD